MATHRVAATGAEGRVSLALFVDLPPDHRVRGAAYAAWRRDRVRRARAVRAQTEEDERQTQPGLGRRQTALRLYTLTPALRPRRILTEAQIAAFIRDGVVVPGVLSKERLAAARRGLAATLQRHGVSMEDAATRGLRRLSTTRRRRRARPLLRPLEA